MYQKSKMNKSIIFVHVVNSIKKQSPQCARVEFLFAFNTHNKHKSRFLFSILISIFILIFQWITPSSDDELPSRTRLGDPGGVLLMVTVTRLSAANLSSSIGGVPSSLDLLISGSLYVHLVQCF